MKSEYENVVHLEKLFCINFTRWKQNYIRAFLSELYEPVFVSSARDAISKGFSSSSILLSWASKNQKEVEQLTYKFGILPWYMEDGFIRSTGLGTDLTAPASLVLDKRGIYYDPTRPSDLETLLQNKQFSTKEKERAARIRQMLISNELSKYNLGRRVRRKDLAVKEAQQIILVPGQVEGDASIRKGCVDISTNSALLQAVRHKAPEAFILYKPHPDVVSGNRAGKVDNRTLSNCCDTVLTDSSITDCLAIADEVHTMTSLVGFEGLLRGLRVACYGRPFYSGWGLTHDSHKVESRKRRLLLDELVAGTLIDYPLYYDWATGRLTTPEKIIQQLADQISQQGGKQSNQVNLLLRKFRKIKNYFYGIKL